MKRVVSFIGLISLVLCMVTLPIQAADSVGFSSSSFVYDNSSGAYTFAPLVSGEFNTVQTEYSDGSKYYEAVMMQDGGAGYKYVVSYNDTQFAAVSKQVIDSTDYYSMFTLHSVNINTLDVDGVPVNVNVAEVASEGTVYADAASALAVATLVPDSTYFSINYNLSNESNYSTFVANASKCKLLIYDSSDTLVETKTLTTLGSLVTETQPETLGSEVTAPTSLKMTKGSALADGGFTYTFSWSLNGENAAFCEIYDMSMGDPQADGSSPLVTLDPTLVIGAESGSVTLDLPLEDGAYAVRTRTNYGNDYLTKFSITGSKVAVDPAFVGAKVTIEGNPAIATVEPQTDVTIKLKADKPVLFTVNGTTDIAYGLSTDFVVRENGIYAYIAYTETGIVSEGTIEVNCFRDAATLASLSDKVVETTWTGSTPLVGKLAQTGLVSVPFIVGIALILIGCACIIIYFKRKKGAKHEEI